MLDILPLYLRHSWGLPHHWALGRGVGELLDQSIIVILAIFHHHDHHHSICKYKAGEGDILRGVFEVWRGGEGKVGVISILINLLNKLQIEDFKLRWSCSDEYEEVDDLKMF